MILHSQKERKTHPAWTEEKTGPDKEMNAQLEEMVLLNNQYLHEIRRMNEELINLKKRLFSDNPNCFPETESEHLLYKIQTLETRNFDLRNSFSFRIGQVLIDAVSKPGKNTIILPFRFISLIFDYAFNRKHG